MIGRSGFCFLEESGFVGGFFLKFFMLAFGAILVFGGAFFTVFSLGAGFAFDFRVIFGAKAITFGLSFICFGFNFGVGIFALGSAFFGATGGAALGAAAFF